VELNGEVDLDFSGVRLHLEGVTPAVERGVRESWAAFVSSTSDAPLLTCHFGRLAAFAGRGPFRPKEMKSNLEVTRAAFTMPEGRAVVDASGEASIDLAGSLGRREYWTAVNLLRACLAWWLPQRGAMLLHAAGLAVGGRGYLLVGPEGSGKSSWARLGEQGGARVVSDDLVLVEATRRGVELLGAPFRSTHEANYGPGRWPLAAILFPRHGERAAWSPAASLIARARILANLPFVAEATARDGRVDRLVERLATDVPCLDLTFALDLAFLELLRSGPHGA
jgi:hypothetical protein